MQVGRRTYTHAGPRGNTHKASVSSGDLLNRQQLGRTQDRDKHLTQRDEDTKKGHAMAPNMENDRNKSELESC